ncbi:MAG: tyrosine-type recombinase/integrase, partial [Chloroflexota bacterium]
MSETPIVDPVEAYYAHLRARGSASATKQVKYALRHLAGFVGAEAAAALPATLIAFTSEKLARFRVYLAELRLPKGAPLAEWTQEGYFAALRGLFRWRARSGRMLVDIAAALPRRRAAQRLPRAVPTQADVRALLDRPNAKETHKGLRDRAMLELLYSTGLRRAEVARLALYDVDLVAGVVRVRQGKNRKDRLVPLGRVAARWVAVYVERARPELVRDGNEAALFIGGRGRALSPAALSTLVWRYVRGARLGKRVSCHLLRHAFATHLLQEGASIRPIQAMLGHATLTSTQIYTRLVPQDLARAIARYHPLERLASLGAATAPAPPPATPAGRKKIRIERKT